LINRDLIAVIGLVGAVAILGGAFTHVLWQNFFQIQEKESLQEEIRRLQDDNELLQEEIRKLQENNELLQEEIAKIESASSKIPKPEKTVQDSSKLTEIITLAIGQHSMISEQQNLIIKSNDDLVTLWLKITTENEFPSVDFDSNVVVGVFSGEKPNLCYSVNVESLSQFVTNEGLITTVNLKNTIPSDELNCPTRTISPYHIVQIPFIPDEIYFSEE